MNPSWPQDKLMDEGCWSDKEYCRKTENWYCLSKTLAEADALDYAAKHGLDVVTVCPAMVLGPLLQATVNSSSLFLLNLLKVCLQCAGEPRWVRRLSSNVLRCRAISGALEHCKGSEALYTGHNVLEHRHESFHLVSHLARLLCFERESLSEL
ncbi:cinnamoyl-CoA reductase 2-like [Iris pallida]|uniref:Cinnamoyl-CoA reductase 2-like n=1 Tax=Iris pallida TaxID=29817 RepID=A0AAX6GWI6_IRIPA|nr:cinnamoyl-CoA reductase 2-like [Iris pallida]